ncbi:DNA-binding LacI/PurR family transcriptional regulator [Microbacterium phyllosphaerae]|uniref:DNA-binding LacI/PurR family transcriptional regulator n=1 Tax=Microbacterium phyllosphaerae TaxID=124798 RepID=A0ABS4WNB7_9MICO|nr:LacI family DNA-binding transcriptional regulator [Microbacterium phyllosphaerae]MBP2377697.1 DNA-binding LacI/PurR family transcriptional regulator [Microbacterium phyllosphaerae]
MEKRPTSHDVAHLAGVSQSTVSFVFTGRAGISEATREKVLRAASELNYRPNLAARSMRTQRTGRLAVVVPITTMNPLTLLSGAIAAARDEGYVVEVVTLPDDAAERVERLAEVVDSGQYEGVLGFTPLPFTDTTGGGPIVLSVGEFDDAMHMTGEFTDSRPIVEMIERLAAQGHRRFIHLAGAEDFPSARARRDAYLATIDRLGLESLGVTGGDWSGKAGEDAIDALPDDTPPLAVIAANDVIATGAIRAATRRGWRLPQEVAVTGWDDHHQSAFLVPSLTSVVQDRERLGAYSMQRLIAAVRGSEPPRKPDGLLTIVWRESTESPQRPA